MELAGGAEDVTYKREHAHTLCVCVCVCVCVSMCGDEVTHKKAAAAVTSGRPGGTGTC